MPETIFDILTATTESTGGDYLSPRQQHKQSICAHLQRLLNSRRNSLTHVPDFGMPDMAALYLDLPYTRDTIINSILYAVQQHEPRLSWPRVQAYASKPGQSMTHFQLIGKDGAGIPLRFTVSLCRSGLIRVTSSEDYSPDE